jgi:signal transduction histidine kinase/CheY-like chemotaxis protein
MKPGEFAGRFQDFVALVHPDDRERVQQEFANARKSGQGFHSERRVLRPSGEVRYLQIQVEVVKDATGRVVRMLGICRDVTEQREAEKALERTREQLTQMQKMEALGQLTGGIAHDFNNLLMIVSGHAEMLRRRLSDPKPLQGLDAILAAARRGESLTRQLLTFSRRQPLNAVPVNLKQRIEAMRAMLGSSLRGNISFTVDIPDDLWPVEVDVAELELALVNVAVNARDAMPEGGSFTVSARNLSASPEARGGQSGDDHVELTLTDTGTGIAPDVIKKIFDPFFTTKAVGKGTGLGLSQVYGFAHQSGGSVTVKSEVGRGTTIALTLPRSLTAVPAATETAEPPIPRPAEGTILVVEDNPEVRDVTATLLEQMGYRVLRAENAAEALALLQRGQEVDLVFSDIVMPNGMNSIHLAQEVSERYPKLRFLLTTDYSEVTAAAETRFAVLRKPFELSELERAVREALAGTSNPALRRARGSAKVSAEARLKPAGAPRA